MNATPVYLDPPSPVFDPSAGYPPAAVRAEFGRRLQARMHVKKWNQSELARQAGIGRDNVSSYIRGKAMPTALTLDKLANALGCLPSDLLPASVGAASARPGTAQDEAIPLEIRQLGGGQVWIRINRAVSLDQATRIMNVLNETSAPQAAGPTPASDPAA